MRILDYKLTIIFVIFTLVISIYWIIEKNAINPIEWILIHTIAILYGGLIGDTILKQNYS